MKTAKTYPFFFFPRSFFLALAACGVLVSCDDNSITPAEQEIAAFSQQLQGTWILDKVTKYGSDNAVVTIAPVREYACDKVSNAFDAKDVVNKYTINYSDKVVHVKKQYTCRLAPEELSWKIDLDNSNEDEGNWMSGKNFSIKEINEATMVGEFKLIFFNLDNCDPNGKPATSSTKNKLILDVSFDQKEKSTFRLEFSKTK